MPMFVPLNNRYSRINLKYSNTLSVYHSYPKARVNLAGLVMIGWMERLGSAFQLAVKFSHLDPTLNI